MKRLFIVGIVLLLVFSLGFRKKFSTPKETLNTQIQAGENGDEATYVECFVRSAQEKIGSDFKKMPDFTKQLLAWVTQVNKSRNYRLDKQEATKARMLGKDPSTGKEFYLYFVKEAGQWKIFPEHHLQYQDEASIPKGPVTPLSAGNSDLIITNLSFDEKSIRAGKIVKISTTVKNIGREDAKGYFVIALYIDGQLWQGLGTNVVAGLARNKTITYHTMYIFKKKGSYKVIASVDKANQVKETNDNNNELKKTIAIR